MLRIGGVPEHFNLPWLKLKAENPNLISWEEFPGGTGAMLDALQADRVDLIVALTEGVIKAQMEGKNLSIIDYFVSSPLCWGIHVAANSSYHEVNQLEGKKVAVSRLNSGSDLMAHVLKTQQNWRIPSERVPVGTLQGALIALPNQEADYFLWEKISTQFACDQEVFRRIAEIQSPWPCFVMAVNSDKAEVIKAKLKPLMERLQHWCQWTKSHPDAIPELMSIYSLNRDQVTTWRNVTDWFEKQWNEQEAGRIQELLLQYGVIKK